MQLQLDKRRLDDKLRKLEVPNKSLIDFWSNDYLGLSKHAELQSYLKGAISEMGHLYIGATGSRLISGNYARLEQLESFLAKSMQAGSATFFPSTYLANIALLGSLATRHDTYVIDVSCHASLKEGVRLSQAQKLTFFHNEVQHLERQLNQAKGQTYVVTESLFSMEGDFSPLGEILSVCKEKGAILIVDEAHASGLFGAGGSGLVEETGLVQDDVVRIVGFGKAFGQAGGTVLGPANLKPWMSNFALPFIYSTAPSPVQVETLSQTLHWLEPKLQGLQVAFRQNLKRCNSQWSLVSRATQHSPIQQLMCSSVQDARRLADVLRMHNIGAKAILPPTVPEGRQQLRFTWHLFNTMEEMELLVSLVGKEAQNA